MDTVGATIPPVLTIIRNSFLPSVLPQKPLVAPSIPTRLTYSTVSVVQAVEPALSDGATVRTVSTGPAYAQSLIKTSMTRRGSEFYAAGHDMANRTDGGLHIIMLNVFFTDLTEPYAIEQPDLYWGHAGGSPALPSAGGRSR